MENDDEISNVPEGETTMRGRKRRKIDHVLENGVLRNMGSVGASSQRQLSTAVEHFRMFCHYTPGVPEIEELAKNDITEDVVGHFATFLYLRWSPQDPQILATDRRQNGEDLSKERKFTPMQRPTQVGKFLKVKGALSYLSQVRSYLEDRFSEEGTPFTLFEKGSGQWYRKIRTNLITSFVERCIVEGETVSDAAPDISLKDLEYLCELLFIEGSKQSLEIRSLLKADFISIGRISDSAMFGWVNLNLNPHLKCLKTMILSRKTW